VRRSALLWLMLAALLACAPVVASGADFTVTSQSPGNAFVAAADFNTVVVSMTDPGTPLRGVVPLTATASSERGIASVTFQSSPAGAGTWTNACQATVAPYTCNWDTAGVADGSRDLRAVALDQAGYQKTFSVNARLIDNTLPGLTFNDPGILHGVVPLSATASDGGSGLASLAIAYRPAGGSWTTLCSGAASPQACNLSTGALTDGSYEVRATATDVAGNSRVTAYTRNVDNTAPSVSVTPPSPFTALRGAAATVAASASDALSGITSVTIEYRPMSGGAWTQICVDNVAPYACTSFNTTGLNNQYEFRATAVDGATLSTTSASLQNIWIDNTVPSASTVTNPGTPLAGTEAVSGTGTDAHSGVSTWQLQYRVATTGTWTDACNDTSSPYTCNWVTTGLTDGLYDLRAITTDNAGNTTTSTTVTNRRVDNTAPTVSLTNPGTPLSGTVALAATASDSVGVAGVSFERSPAGAGTWTQICNDTTSAYSCSFNTTLISDGTYDLRAVATDTAGNQTVSLVSNRVIDNAPRGVDIQTTNGGTAGRLGSSDTITLTFSEPILTTSVLAGWNGTSQAIRISVTNNASADQLDFTTTGGVRLPLVLSNIDLVLNGNFVSNTVTFNATMVQSGNAITVTVGTQASGFGNLATSAAAGAMTWRPSATLTDATAHACATTTVTESGGSDIDF
jgi:chitinase